METNLWFVLLDNGIQGPFPAGLICRYIVLGRFSTATQVSHDRHHWSLASEHPELIPDMMQHEPPDRRDQERLLAARRWEDERSNADRRSVDASMPRHERRGSPDRRHSSDRTGGYHRHNGLPADRTGQLFRDRRQFLGVVAVVIVILAILSWLAINETWFDKGLRDCSSRPAAAVNWNHCSRRGETLVGVQLTGAQMRSMDLARVDLSAALLIAADLSYADLVDANLSGANLSKSTLLGVDLRNADLTDAQLTDANLSYADLRGARLDGADLTGTVLDRALWLNGRICADQSIGKCR